MTCAPWAVKSSDTNGEKVPRRAKCSLSFASRMSYGNLSQQMIHQPNKHEKGQLIHSVKYSRGSLYIV